MLCTLSKIWIILCQNFATFFAGSSSERRESPLQGTVKKLMPVSGQPIYCKKPECSLDVKNGLTLRKSIE